MQLISKQCKAIANGPVDQDLAGREAHRDSKSRRWLQEPSDGSH